MQELHFCGCSSLEVLPSCLGNLTSFQELELGRCESLKVVPRSLEELSSLSLLGLSFYERIQDVPFGLGKLTSLVDLYLHGCWISSIPKSIVGLNPLILELFRRTTMQTEIIQISILGSK